MTSFILKIIGMITMLSDHIGDALIGKFSYFNFIGRISFPIFAFQAVEGYINTKDLKKHFLKLFLFACISQVPFMLFLSTFTNEFSLNIFFTFILGLFALLIYDKCKNKLFGLLAVVFLSVVGQFIHVDYGAFGVLLIFCFYFFRDKKALMAITTILLCIGRYFIKIITYPNLFSHYFLCILFTCFSLIFILTFNKKEGPKAKYFFYVFYPLHLLILYFLNMAL